MRDAEASVWVRMMTPEESVSSAAAVWPAIRVGRAQPLKLLQAGA